MKVISRFPDDVTTVSFSKSPRADAAVMATRRADVMVKRGMFMGMFLSC
jgi:hypothetical protein